jgi:hypothetical protein
MAAARRLLDTIDLKLPTDQLFQACRQCVSVLPDTAIEPAIIDLLADTATPDRIARLKVELNLIGKNPRFGMAYLRGLAADLLVSRALILKHTGPTK